MSLDVQDVRAYVVRPALRALGEGYATEAAEHLVLGTGATESGFRWLHQVGAGPAVGLWQMEPATYRDIWANFLRYHDALRARVLAFGSRAAGDPPPAEEMSWNLQLAAAMCRVHYLRDPSPLPAPRQVQALAATWKRHYNTVKGAGRAENFVAAWQRHVAPIL